MNDCLSFRRTVWICVCNAPNRSKYIKIESFQRAYLNKFMSFYVKIPINFLEETRSAVLPLSTHTLLIQCRAVMPPPPPPPSSSSLVASSLLRDAIVTTHPLTRAHGPVTQQNLRFASSTLFGSSSTHFVFMCFRFSSHAYFSIYSLGNIFALQRYFLRTPSPAPATFFPPNVLHCFRIVSRTSAPTFIWTPLSPTNIKTGVVRSRRSLRIRI